MGKIINLTPKRRFAMWPEKSGKKNCGIFMSVLMVLLVFCIFVYPVHSSSKKPIKLKVACWLPEPSIEGRMARWWGNELEKRSNGKVKISYYYGQALVKTMDALLSLTTPGPVSLLRKSKVLNTSMSIVLKSSPLSL